MFFWTDTPFSPSPSTPSPTDGWGSALNSSESLDESLLRALGREWSEYSISGVDFRTMIMYSDVPVSKEEPHTNSSFTAVSLQPPGSQQRRAFVQAANSSLRAFYSQHSPTKDKPAVAFISLSRSCHVLAVLRDEWENLLHLDQWTCPSPERMTQLFPNLVIPSSQEQRDRLFSEKTTAYDFNETMLCSLGIVPPQHIIVSIMTFDYMTRISYPPTPPMQSSPAHEFTDGETRKRARPIASDESHTDQTRKPRRVCSSSSRVPLTQVHPMTSGKSATHSSADWDHTGSSQSQAEQYPMSLDSPELLSLDYFHRLISDSPNRSWVSGAIFGNHKVSLLSCDREGIAKSSPIDIRSREGSKLLNDWILGLGSRTMEQWGFTNLFGLIGKRIEETEFDIPHTNLHLSFGPLRYRQRGIFGRCTNVYDVTIRTGGEVIDAVCKIAWPVSTRSNESELIAKARAVDPVHTPEVHYTVDVVTALPSRNLRMQCGSASPVEPRTMRVTVMTRYRPIDELKGPEFLDAFTQIMKCTFSLVFSVSIAHLPLPGNMHLVEAGSIHHRDLSPGNMMYYRDGEGRATGVLTDFDLAARLDEPAQISSRRGVHGTAPFMPRVLLTEENVEHTLTHDWESALYILTWIGMGYKHGQPPSESHNPLRGWKEGSWTCISAEKLYFLSHEGRYETIMDDIHPEYSCLVRPIEELRDLIEMQTMAERMKRCRIPVEMDVSPLTPSVFFDALKV
jgi:Fungal protein kinase